VEQTHRIVNLIVDIQFGTDPAFIERVRRSADALRARGIPTIWLTMDNRSQLFEPTESWPSTSLRSRNIGELEQGGFFGHEPDATEEQLRKFREHFSQYGPRTDEAMYPKAFFDAFSTPESIKHLGARQHYVEQERPQHIGGIDNVFYGQTFLDYLKSLGVEQVTIMGGNADVCVTETAMGAARNGIGVTILSDHLVSGKDRVGNNPPVQYENELQVLHDQTLDRPHELVNYPTKKALSAGTMYSDTDKAAIKNNVQIETLDNFLWSAPELFPDAVVHPFVDEARRLMPANFEARPATTSLPEPRFSLEDSRTLILTALNNFDADLGRKAAEIMGNPARWRLREVPPEQARVMRSLPAESQQTKFNPVNPNPYAVIEYDFDGTMDGVVYMAHELGHAIADDCIREAGYTYRHVPQNLAETQAYFVQNIVYDYSSHHPEATIAAAAKQHFVTTVRDYLHTIADADLSMHGRPMSMVTGLSIFNLSKEQDADKRRKIIETLLGRQGPKNITQILAEAGVETPSDMHNLARSTIEGAINFLNVPTGDVSEITPIDTTPTRGGVGRRGKDGSRPEP